MFQSEAGVGGNAKRVHLFSVACGMSQRPFWNLFIFPVVARHRFRFLGFLYMLQFVRHLKSDAQRKLCGAEGTTLPFLVRKAQWVSARERSVPALKITPQQILFGTSLCLPRSPAELRGGVVWILRNCPELCPCTDDSDGWGGISFLNGAFCFSVLIPWNPFLKG